MSEAQFPEIAGLILAGGEGRRLGGVDKGLVEWQGRPMAAWVGAAMDTLVSPVMISANRSQASYRLISSHVFEDEENYRQQGPLSGLLAGLQAAREQGRQAVLVCPCDTPEVSSKMLEHLCQTWRTDRSRAVITESEGRLHPLHGVYPVESLEALAEWMAGEERRVQPFTRLIGACRLDCSEWQSSLTNRNYPEDFR